MPTVLRKLLLLSLVITATVLSTWLVFFITIELFPGLLDRFLLTGIHYYALKQRYVTDAELVFVYRHTGYIFRWWFTGDLHRYGISPEAVEYAATYDGHGFRKSSAGPPYDTAVIGDSYIEFGETDEITFPEVLGRQTGLSVMNLGRAWYGPHQYLELFRRYAVSARPRYAVLCFFAGNDFDDITEYEKWKAEGRYYFYRRDVLARFLKVSEETFGLVARKTRWLFGKKTNSATVDRSTFGIVEVGDHKVPMAFAYWERDIIGRERAVLKAILSEFKGVAESQGITTILVYVPTATQVHAGGYSRESHPAFIERVKSIKGDPSLDAVSRIADELKIKLINLLPVFRAEAGRGRLLYYPFDTHWNPEGRRVAAALVAPVLSQEIGQP
jgi:hypothetical protein